jgi:hypothetical protein
VRWLLMDILDRMRTRCGRPHFLRTHADTCGQNADTCGQTRTKKIPLIKVPFIY